ncbi:MAG TPA: spore coat protein [Firmicutes bacterium]|jgi:spore coat protein CotF|nr:spore coat protein [Bacillota bacterium]
MNLNLTAKERTLLEDQKSHEEICVQKYSDYANLASDQQLKEIFAHNAQKEQEHLNTINQLLNGQLPNLNQQGSNMANQTTQQQQQIPQMQKMQQRQPLQQQAQAQQFQLENNLTANQSQDQNLCTDMLMTEKYVSGAYDTAIFEFRDPQVRQILNHIQKEEQQHGEAIFNYMESMGMYNPK